MRIVTWNCHGAFRKKYHEIQKLNADVYVIQECEDPNHVRHEAYQAWSAGGIWTGANRNKGLGIFSPTPEALGYLSWPASIYELFLPCSVGDQLNVLGAWTKQANSPNFAYIGQFWRYLQDNWPRLVESPVIIAGDFNSNARWDEWDRWWNHTDVVNQLASLGIDSVYHRWTGEAQGEETQPTFFMHRRASRPYHIDYLFASQSLLERLVAFKVHDDPAWLELSDHLPLSLDLRL